jgi:hypothetical protein
MLQLSSSDSTLVASILHFDLIDDVVAINQEAANHRASAPRSIQSPVERRPQPATTRTDASLSFLLLLGCSPVAILRA